MNARVAEGLPLARTLASQMYRRVGRRVAYEELLSYANEGLMLASRSFDESRRVPFRCWAALKIRGALMEGLRQIGKLPKRVYRQLLVMEAADRVAEGLVEETSIALASGVAISAEAADQRLSDALGSMATAMALAANRPADVDVDALADQDEEGFVMTPEELTSKKELRDRMREAIAELPDAERHLLDRHYFGGVTIDEAAREIGLSKSWASRLHARAAEAVYKAMKRRA